MKKVVVVFLVISFFASLLDSDAAFAKQFKHIMDFFDDKGTIKTYISDIKNSSGDNNVDTRALQSAIETALEGRRSHNIDIVSSESDADMVIDIEITEYFFTEEDPIDMVFSPVAAAVDAAKAENYVRMQIDAVATDAKSGRELWDDHVQSTITDDTMSEEASHGMAYERIAKNFIKELFRKPKKRR